MPTFRSPDKPQIAFLVKEMTSERSAGVVMGVLKQLDDRATVRVDLSMRRVEIDPKTAEADAFRDAIRHAGYSTVRQWPSDHAYLWA